ncbi:MAG: hypothetical protein JO347_09500 [Candidatus Eremiobacteraeota bacterium]|nr:hypothetical protein [Candidatus Eremiobacteraeota bacterium]
MHDRAGRYATLAVELALARNLYEVAARAYSVLYQIAYDDTDDPIVCLAILDKLLEAGRKGGSLQVRLYGLMASFALEAERGDEAALERIGGELEAVPSDFPLVRAEVLLPALALRSAWRREFARAYELLAGTAERQTTEERRASRSAEIALYAFAAGMNIEGTAAAADALAALEHSPTKTRRALRARLLLAIAELIRGRSNAAHRLLGEVERALDPSMRRLRALSNAVRTLYRVSLESAEPAVFAGALERLRAEQFGGMARLLDVLPAASEGGSR